MIKTRSAKITLVKGIIKEDYDDSKYVWVDYDGEVWACQKMGTTQIENLEIPIGQQKSEWN